MKDTRANKNGEKCPTCTKPMTKVGRTGKFRCSNPECPVVVVRRDDGRRSKSLSRSGWIG